MALKNSKIDLCLHFVFEECTLPPPSFAHANVTSVPVPNKGGDSVEYACHHGYTAGNQSTSILCDKDPSFQGVKWTGNFTCKSKLSKQEVWFPSKLR